jgi:small nuclear ribonucleoprotein B and B'
MISFRPARSPSLSGRFNCKHSIDECTSNSLLSFSTLLFKQPSGKGSKLLRYVEHRLRVTLHDGRTIVGTFLAFDKHLNLVLSEAEESRVLRKGGAALLEERTENRNLGLVLIRGENVVSLAVEGPPPPSAKSAVGIAAARGRGTVMSGPPPSSGRGVAPMGLGAAPMHGLGAPGMMPPPPPPPPGGGMPLPGMGRGMPPPF